MLGLAAATRGFRSCLSNSSRGVSSRGVIRNAFSTSRNPMHLQKLPEVKPDPLALKKASLSLEGIRPAIGLEREIIVGIHDFTNFYTEALKALELDKSDIELLAQMATQVKLIQYLKANDEGKQQFEQIINPIKLPHIFPNDFQQGALPKQIRLGLLLAILDFKVNEKSV